MSIHSLEGSGYYLCSLLAEITSMYSVVYLVEACFFCSVLVDVIDLKKKSSLNEPFVSSLLDSVIGKICICCFKKIIR